VGRAGSMQPLRAAQSHTHTHGHKGRAQECRKGGNCDTTRHTRAQEGNHSQHTGTGGVLQRGCSGTRGSAHSAPQSLRGCAAQQRARAYGEHGRSPRTTDSVFAGRSGGGGCCTCLRHVTQCVQADLPNLRRRWVQHVQAARIQ